MLRTLDAETINKHYPASNQMFANAIKFANLEKCNCVCNRWRGTIEATKGLVTRLLETTSRIGYTTYSLATSIPQFNFSQVKSDLIGFGSIVKNLLITVEIAFRVLLSPLFPKLLGHTAVEIADVKAHQSVRRLKKDLKDEKLATTAAATLSGKHKTNLNSLHRIIRTSGNMRTWANNAVSSKLVEGNCLSATDIRSLREIKRSVFPTSKAELPEVEGEAPLLIGVSTNMLGRQSYKLLTEEEATDLNPVIYRDYLSIKGLLSESMIKGAGIYTWTGNARNFNGSEAFISTLCEEQDPMMAHVFNYLMEAKERSDAIDALPEDKKAEIKGLKFVDGSIKRPAVPKQPATPKAEAEVPPKDGSPAAEATKEEKGDIPPTAKEIEAAKAPALPSTPSPKKPKEGETTIERDSKKD